MFPYPILTLTHIAITRALRSGTYLVLSSVNNMKGEIKVPEFKQNLSFFCNKQYFWLLVLGNYTLQNLIKFVTPKILALPRKHLALHANLKQFLYTGIVTEQNSNAFASQITQFKS